MLVRLLLLAAVLVAAGAGSPPAAARVILVGPTRAVKLPSEAAALARSGDRIVFDAGVYRDCAIWYASRLTLEGRQPGAVFTDMICAGRGIFLFYGNDITIRGLTFGHARGPYHHAAGILMEGDNLTVEFSQFIADENGILAGGSRNSRVRVSDSAFHGNGSCEGACAHGIYAGKPIALLTVEHCLFRDTRTAHHIKSRARTTVITNNDIADGETGTSSYLINVPQGGEVLISGNQLHKGANTSNPSAAISIGEEPIASLPGTAVIRGNRFVSDVAQPTAFVRNRTAVPAILANNQISGTVTMLDGPGTIDANAE